MFAVLIIASYSEICDICGLKRLVLNCMEKMGKSLPGLCGTPVSLISALWRDFCEMPCPVIGIAKLAGCSLTPRNGGVILLSQANAAKPCRRRYLDSVSRGIVIHVVSQWY